MDWIDALVGQIPDPLASSSSRSTPRQAAGSRSRSCGRSMARRRTRGPRRRRPRRWRRDPTRPLPRRSRSSRRASCTRLGSRGGGASRPRPPRLEARERRARGVRPGRVARLGPGQTRGQEGPLARPQCTLLELPQQGRRLPGCDAPTQVGPTAPWRGVPPPGGKLRR